MDSSLFNQSVAKHRIKCLGLSSAGFNSRPKDVCWEEEDDQDDHDEDEEDDEEEEEEGVAIDLGRAD